VIQGIERSIDDGRGVINPSFGFDGYDRMLADEIDVAFGTGSLVVAAAGNDFLAGNAEHSPAGLPHVLTVAATDEQNQSSFFSNRSLAVDLAAPGENIPSRCRRGQARPATRRATARASPRRSSPAPPRGSGPGVPSST
jgi:thermitase